MTITAYQDGVIGYDSMSLFLFAVAAGEVSEVRRAALSLSQTRLPR
jgi:hypothetical protein